VPSQHYHDVFVGYRFGPTAGQGRGAWQAAERLVRNTDIRLGVKNVFNTKPPFDTTNSYLYYSGFGDPRLASYYVTVKRSF
jgi:outer membrane receptor protein involved in Fe transport